MNKSDRKIVLFYTDTPYAGGAENQMYLLAKFLDKEKYEVKLICSDYKSLGDWAARFEAEGIEVVKLNVFHKHDPRHYVQLKEYIKREPCDLMHIHVWNPASCRYAFMAANKYNLPLIVTEHDPFELPKFKKYIKNKLMRRVQKIVTVSHANEKLMQNLFPELKNYTTTILNGIDATWFESQLLNFSEAKIKEFREEEFDASDDTKVILTVAELHERKGLTYLIKAMPTILEKIPNTKLVIVGEGPQRPELEKLIQEKNIKLLGHRKDIPKLMASANLFVLPSVKEAFGLVILEAMAAWLPVLASNVGGIPEIIEDNVNGFLVEPKDSDALAKKILELFNENFKFEEYIKNAQAILKDKFDAKAMAKQYEKIYG
ncbi:glycosyltransferase family 4 protein [Patescibacteria group bacterium]